MKKVMLFTVSIILICSDAYAANLAMITSTPTIMDIVILICGVGCVFGAIKILNLVRGGQFSKSWQFLLSGFIVLIVVQLLRILNAIEILMLPVFIIPACIILMMGLFLYGIIEAKRILS